MIEDYVNAFSNFLMIATDDYIIKEQSGVGIHVRQVEYSFSVYLLDYTSIVRADMIAITLAFRKIPVSVPKVAILSGSRACATP